MKLLIVGATGAVGQKVLKLALSDGMSSQEFSQVHVLSRKPIDDAAINAGAINHVANFDELTGSEPCWQVDVVICALGTTLKQAGSKSRFFTIEHDYVMAVARHAADGGAKHFLYVSSIGANVDSKLSFYLATKGLIEQHLQAIGFNGLTILRPSLLEAKQRPDTRVAESIGLWFNRHLGFILPRGLRSIKVEKVAEGLLKRALIEGKRANIVEVDDI